MPPSCTYRCSYGPLALLLTLALTHGVYDVQAQPQAFRFEHFTVEDGLPDASVFSILQDRLGFLWLGTGNGLVRYDGYTLEVFAPNPNVSYSIGSGRIYGLYEDEQGDLWVSTFGGGLNHFDRATEQFTRFVHDPDDPHSLTTDQLTRLTPDGKGYIWAETNGAGLNRVEVATGRITRFRHAPEEPGSLSDDVVHDLLVDRQGRVWVGTPKGLNRFDEASGRFVRYGHDPEVAKILSHDTVRVLAEDKGGRLWVGTDGGLKRFDESTGVLVHHRHDPADSIRLGHARVHALLAGRDGTLWVGTEHGLNRLNAATGGFTRFLPRPEASHPSYNRILDIYEDRTGLLWVRTDDPIVGADEFGLHSGFNLYTFDPETGVFIEQADDPDNPNSITILGGIRAMLEDQAGTLWIGTFLGGLNKLDRSTSKFRHFAYPAGEGHSRVVTAIYEDSQERLWVATGIVNPRPRDVGLHLLDRMTGRFTHFRLGTEDPERLNMNLVMELIEDRAGRLWLFTLQGVRRFDPATGMGPLYVPYPEAAFPSNVMRGTFEDHEGQLWIGTYNEGLVRFDPSTGTFTRTYRPNPDDPGSIPVSRVSTIHGDREGTLWLATEQGLVRFDPATERFTLLEDARLGRFITRAIHDDRQGHLWLATSPHGLVRFDVATGMFTSFTERDGFTSNSASAVLEDEEGNLWVSSNRGLAWFDPERTVFRNYDADDGLGGNEFSNFTAFKTRDGELFFGGTHGLNAFFPDEVHDNPHPPQVALTGLRIFDEPLRPSQDGPLQEYIADADEIRLNHRQNDVTFEYVALHFSRPGENQYAYRLEGYEDNWRHVGAQRTAIYPNLPPGEYVFRVKAANYDGVWNEEGAAVRLVVVPPWWRTGWAYGLYALGLAALLLTGNRLQRRRLVIRERERARIHEAHLKAEAAEERAATLRQFDEAKSRFFANISHEFRTPLTLILNPLQDLLEGHSNAEDLARQAPAMRRSARRLLRLVNQLLDLSRLEAGRLTLDRRPGDLVAFLGELVRAFMPLAERRKIALQYKPEVEVQPFVFDPDALEKVVSNLLSNALKFTPEGGKIWVTMIPRTLAAGAVVEVVIKDTGPGISSSELERIFDRFEQVDTSATRAYEGTGLGLALARELVELHGGTLRAESEVGFGSAFIVRLPLQEQGEAGHTRKTGPSGDGAVELEEAALLFDAAEKLVKAVPLPGKGADRPLVLVVEDNPDVLQLLRDYLATDYRVLEASDGAAGLETARTHRPDLVLTDVMMPRMDGYELCRHLKADEALRATPVMLLTAKAAETDRIYGLEGGADDYLAKPFSKRELLVRIANLILSRRHLREQYSREITVRPADVVIRAEDEAFLEQVLRLFETHLADSAFTVDQLGEEVGLSQRQVYRKVKDVTGETPAELLRRMRLERAAQLLQAHPGTVAEVAYAVGFRSPSHFSAAFRKAFGVTPSEHIANTP